jgi:hypothetical protein
VRSFLLFLESCERCHTTFPNRTKYLIVAPGKLDSQIKPAQNSRLSYSITGASLIGDFANATENSTDDGTCPVKVALPVNELPGFGDRPRSLASVSLSNGIPCSPGGGIRLSSVCRMRV